MSGIDVRATDGGAMIFTVTERDRAPWGSTNTTIFVTPDDLALLTGKLQACLQEIQQRQVESPAFATGQAVRVVGNFRNGQQGKVIEVEHKESRLEQRSGERWSYTVYFEDGSTWVYSGSELEHLS